MVSGLSSFNSMVYHSNFIKYTALILALLPLVAGGSLFCYAHWLPCECVHHKSSSCCQKTECDQEHKCTCDQHKCSNIDQPVLTTPRNTNLSVSGFQDYACDCTSAVSVNHQPAETGFRDAVTKSSAPVVRLHLLFRSLLI